MTYFQFASARESGGEKFDRRPGRHETGWTGADLRQVVLQHASRFGPDRTAKIAKSIMGTFQEPVDPKFYSAMIAYYTYELTERPHVDVNGNVRQLEK